MKKASSQVVTAQVWLCIALLAGVAVLAGCDRAGPTTDATGNQGSAGEATGNQPVLGQVVEFDDYTLRANVTRTDLLPDAMARQYGIQPAPDLFLLNVVVLETRPDREPVTVSANVSAQHEILVGQVETIEMREVEANGFISYIGTLDAGSRRILQLVLEALPAGSDQPLQMTFEVQLEAVEGV